jgi:hypothetical protein
MPSSSFSTITANFKIDHNTELVNGLTKIFSYCLILKSPQVKKAVAAAGLLVYHKKHKHNIVKNR